MNHKVETQWMGKMKFNSLVNGHTIVMDVPERVGGEDHGPIPKPFLLTALSGCTSMDVVALLKKQGKELEYLNIEVIGDISKTAPIEYVSANIIYEIRGNEEDKPASIQAIRDSQEKICGVSHMLKKIMPVTYSLIYNGKEVLL